MRRLLIMFMLIAGLTGFTGYAQDNADTVEGYVSIGARFADGDDDLSQAAEYETTDSDIGLSVELDVTAGTEDRFIAIQGDIKNADDVYTSVEMQVNQAFIDTLYYKRYSHRLDHDRMENLVFRECVDPATNKPGGKMLTHEDTDPCGEYGIVISDLQNRMEFDMGEHTTFHWNYTHLSREGYKQTRSINHCAMCHVTARKTRVDEETRDHSVGLSLAFSKFEMAYNFVKSEFRNFAEAPRNYYEPARHPVNGDTEAEFASRTNYQDEELTYADVPDSDKESHTFKFTGRLSKHNTIVSQVSMLKYENLAEQLKMETRSGAVHWACKPNKKFAVRTTFSKETIENDDVVLDFAAWREGFTGGGQNFDWTRQSAYNRDVTIARLQTEYRFNQAHRISFDYRFRNIDREYLEIEQGSTETETLENRFVLAWNGNMDKVRGRIAVEYQMIDLPFANKYAMCEPAYRDSSFLPDNSKFFYFQREHQGDATNQPSDSLKLKANFSLINSARFAMNIQGTYTDSSNDNLNTYEWTQDSTVSGLNLFITPGSIASFTAGYNYFNIESNAVFCVPVMDG